MSRSELAKSSQDLGQNFLFLPMLFQFCQVHDELERLKNHWAMHELKPKRKYFIFPQNAQSFWSRYLKIEKVRNQAQMAASSKTYGPLACGEAQAFIFTACLIFLSWLLSIFLHISASLDHAAYLLLYAFKIPAEMFMTSISFWKTGVLVPFL